MKLSLPIIALLITCAARGADANAPLGSAAYQPSPERPVGWRGDGTGRYPAATPPTTWGRTKNGNTYATKNILWMAPMPDWGVGCPIIVGQRIFITTEIYDLVCLDKQTGRVLWIRSNPEFEGITDADLQAFPVHAKFFSEAKPGLAKLSADLTKANAELVEALNAEIATSTTAPFKVPAAATKKRAIDKKIYDDLQAIDKKAAEELTKVEETTATDKKPDDTKKPAAKKPEKLFERYWGQGVFGFSGQTPASDGKNVCAFFTTGVSACYDLDGNRKWIHRGKGGGSEHGNFASPLLAGNTFVVWANEMRGYDVTTGKLLWNNPAKGYNTYGSMFRVKAGNDLVAAFQWGFFTRIRDGKPIWDQGIFGDSVQTPIVEGNVIFAHVGYPKNNNEKIGFRAFKIPDSTDSGKLTQLHTFSSEWGENELVVVKEKNPFDRGFVASPLFVDGLIYQITQGAGLLVNDAATGTLVYRKVLPLKPKTHYWDWAGTSASPTLAGKYIHLMDNQGTTLVIQPGREYKEIASNLIEESKDGKSQVQNVSTPIFEGTRMYYRTPGYLYCIGEK
jgi:outer membrane protein assembly factor BamB